MVTASDDGALQIKLTGVPFHRVEATEDQSFIEFIHSWGGTWMWKGLGMPADTK